MAGALNGKSAVEMREFLIDKKVAVPATSSYLEVLSMYNDYVENTADFFTADIDAVKFPILPPRALAKFELESAESPIKPVKTVTFTEIADLLHDPTVLPFEKAGLLSILASFVQVADNRPKGEQHSWVHVIASNVLEMFGQCRVHDADRLKRRAIRHTICAKQPSLLSAKRLTLATYKGEVCLIVGGHSIQASMKPCQYPVTVCFTRDSIIANDCKCKAGCHFDSNASQQGGDQRTVCTHTATPLVQLTMVLFEDMATYSGGTLCSLAK